MMVWLLGVNGLGPIDDHMFVSTVFQGKDFGFYILPKIGRFIPLTAQEYVLVAKAFEPSPLLFYIIDAIKVCFCGVLLLYCLNVTGLADWAIATLWAIVIFSIGFANAAFRLQVGEINILLLTLVLIWAVLARSTMTPSTSTGQKIVDVLGLAAFVTALFYKELVFVFGMAFGAAELVRHYRQKRPHFPFSAWALLAISTCYILSYQLWRSAFRIGSYAEFQSMARSDVVHLFAINDPFIILIVLPLTVFRVLIIIRDGSRHTFFDSLLVAASAYAAAYLALGIYNTYYLLPAYGFAVCGMAGLCAGRSATICKAAVISLAGVLGANNVSVAISDMQALRDITNSHYQFVRSIADWIWLNPLPNSMRRNLVLAGVSSGYGVEVIHSLKKFLNAFRVPDSLFDVKFTEPVDNAQISSFYGLKDGGEYAAKVGDLLVYNPYQGVALVPPLLAPSYRTVYRSATERSLPRWTGWDWISNCVFLRDSCAEAVTVNTRFTGYAAMLVTRPPPSPVQQQLSPLLSPSYRIGPLLFPSRMRAGVAVERNVLVENTGKETWPANGVLTPGIFVHLAYLWINEEGRVALEGGRSPFPEPMRPGDKAGIPVRFTAPILPGKYRLVISPVQESVRWFYPDNDADLAMEIEVF